jgi:hypothetical protein
MDFVIFIFASYGITNILTSGKIFEWLRVFLDRQSKTLGYFSKCPMCMGLWIGAGLSLVGVGTGTHLGRWMDAAVAGAVASGVCWMFRVVLHRLGEDEL